MKLSALRYIICPYCNGRLRLTKSFAQQGQTLHYGIIQCSCDQYPIIDSIVILKKPANRRVLQHINNRPLNRSRNVLIQMQPGYNQLLKSIFPGSIIDSVYHALKHRSLVGDIGYKKILTPFSWFPDTHDWARYLMRLPDSPEPKVVDAIISRMTKVNLVVDVGCGVTPYTSYNRVKSVPSLIGVDANFVLLFLSAVFFPGPNQTLICADLNHGFPARVADVCLSLNCLTYVYNQKKTFLAMTRAVKKNGAVFIGDLPVSPPANPTYWFTQPPGFYTSISRLKHLVVDYDKLLHIIETGRPVDFNSIPFTKTGRGRYGVLFRRDMR